MLTPATLIHDRYCIVRLVGQGAMGAVYEAIDQRIGQPVALKQTLTHDLWAMENIEREALILAGLHHPTLPAVSDTFSDPLGQFLVMTFVPGPTLADMLTQRRRGFPPVEVLTWADQILDALIYLHGQHSPVLHRDIKPQNLKLTPEGAITLLDFGLARGSVLQTRRVGQRSVVGYTLPYAPIEQVRGTDTDPRSDLFALAGTLYHLLTGAPPPDALERAAAQISGQADPLKSLHHRCAEIAPAAAEALDQCLSLDPADRIRSADELRRQLQQSQSNWVAPQPRRAPMPPERLRQLRIILLALVLVGAVIVGWGMLQRSGHQAIGAAPTPSATARVSSPTPTPSRVPEPGMPTRLAFASAPTGVATDVPADLDRQRWMNPTPALGGGVMIVTPTPGVPRAAAGAATRVARTIRQQLLCPDGFNQFGVSSDGQIIAIDCDQKLQVFRIPDGQRILGFDYSPAGFALSHDGTMLAISARGEDIQLWSLKDTQMMRYFRPFSSNDSVISRLAFSMDGKALIVSDGLFRMFALDTTSGTILRTFRGSDMVDSPFIFSSSGRYYAMVRNPDLQIWDYNRGQFITKDNLSFNIDFGYSIAFTSDETSVIVGSMTGRLHRYSLNGKDTELPLTGGWGRLQVAASPIDNLIAIGGENGRVAVYREGNSPAQHMIREGGPAVKSIVFTPDGQAIMVFSEQGFDIINLGDLVSS
jgi:serine/threonine protein kinase